jgi:ATP-binding cassette subfamily B protein
MTKRNTPAIALIKRVIFQARPYWPHLAVLFVLNLLASPIALLKPVALKILIDNAFGSHPLPGVIRTLFPAGFDFTFQAVVLIAVAVAIGVALLDSLNGAVNWLLNVYTGEKLVLEFRTRLFDHLQRLSFSFHDRNGTSDSLYRIQWDTMGIRTLLMNNLSPLISAIITLLSMIVVMFMIKWQFALIALCIIPALFVLTRASANRLRSSWEKVKEDESVSMSVVHEVLSALRVVKAFGQEANESRRFTGKADKAVKGQLKVASIGAGFNFLVGMVFATGTALFLYLGAVDVHAGRMTLGELTLVLAYLGQVFGPLQVISKNINDIQSSITSIDRVYALLDTEEEVKESPRPLPLSRVEGSFEFAHVSFAYSADHPTLHDISFRINPGDRVGVMGSTGAGKSTLIGLLTRFYDPSAGSIRVDGTDIRNYSLDGYRRQFGIVLQEPVLFSATIAENIRYGLPVATDEEIIEAARAANAHDFITGSKDGYDTLVGERGMQLSGGERQRISLARAFIKDAPVLILDEPTSSIDVKTEAQIMEAVERLMQGRTTFLITHRLDTLSTCNVILHLENGRLVDVISNHDPAILAGKKNTFINRV